MSKEDLHDKEEGVDLKKLRYHIHIKMIIDERSINVSFSFLWTMCVAKNVSIEAHW